MNKRIKEKAKDDRMSNHATFIAVKRQETSSVTATIVSQTDLGKDDPAVATVEAKALRTRSQRCTTVVCRSERSPGQRERSAEAEKLPSQSRNNVPQVARSARIDGGCRAAKL